MNKDEKDKNENNEINPSQEESFDMNQGDYFESDLEFIESTEDGEALPTKDIIKKLREEVKKLQKERDEYLTGWQRAKADYINLKRESEESKLNISDLTKERIIRDILPVLDSFDMAFANKESWEKVDSNWRKGIEYIYQQFQVVLSDLGVEKIDKIEIPFDPLIHQSVGSEETNDKKKDHIVKEISHLGYKTQDRVIRPARVVLYEFKD